MARYFIGIDGGSSETVGVILDDNERLVARAVAGPTNYHAVGLEAAERNLLDVIRQLVEKADTTTDDVARFCFALSGVSREADRRAISGLLNRHGLLDRATLVSDAEAVLAATESEASVIVVIAGTGSVVLGRDKHGTLHRVGGHGHLLDDYGSAYDIGLSGLRAVLEAHDGRGPKTALAKTLLAAAGFGDVSEIVPWLYGATEHKREVARLAPVVIEAAAKGDGPAIAIIERAAAELARWVGVAAKTMTATKRPQKIVLAGGVLVHSERYRHLVAERILDELPQAKITSPTHEPAHGAALLALRTP